MNLLTIYAGKTNEVSRKAAPCVHLSLQFTFTSTVRDTENDEVQRTWPKH